MIPLRVQQLPAFVREIFKRRDVMNRTTPSGRTFHLCYFSCETHFQYLYCALHSLLHHAHDIPFKVWIFSDEEQPLSEVQVSAILALLPDSKVTPWPRSIGWSATQIGNIWRAYGVACDGLDDDDIIAKVDSDVFFFNDRIFKAVMKSDADLVGDGHYVNFKYCQGGCYFFKAGAVRKINERIASLGMTRMLDAIEVTAEDAAANHFAKGLGLKVWLTWFMMFPDELRNAGGLTPWYRWKFSCLHFVMKRKTTMLETYEREIFKNQLPEDYLSVINLARS